MTPTEHQEQTLLCVWMTKANIVHFAIPNGGLRSTLEGFKFKREGVKSGVPDIFIPTPMGDYHGLFIELKRKQGGRISEYQRYWLDYLNSQGYLAKVACGFDEAKAIVETYFRV